MLKKNNTIEENYAFIDAQNLHFSISHDLRKNGKTLYKGWKMNLQKFRIYLKEHHKVSKAYLFMGYIPENKKMYENFKKFGFDIVFKEVVSGKNGKPKGNVDAELVLQSSAIDFKKYNKAILVSGDGDFACLVKYLKNENKFKAILAPNRFNCSRLLKKEAKGQITFLEFLKNKLE